MLANAGMGDITGVAAAYERCKAVLEELGVEVSEQTQQLYESLSQGVDPTTASAAAPQPDNREYERRAVQQLLERYRAREGEFLDVPGMAIVNASAGDMTFNQQDTALLVCSALSHDLDVDPWVQRAETPAFAVSALMEVYASYPRPRVRRRIVEALAQSQGAGSDGALFDIASSDDSGEVRSEAALAVAGRGKHSEILEALAQDLGRDRGGSALAAFVAVADRFGIPEGVEGYPKLSVALTLLQIRWRYSRGLIFQRSLKIALGGGLSMAMLQVLLFVSVLISPEKFQEILEVVSLPAWIFINILTGLVWGGLFGAGLGALTSFSDEVLYRDRRWFPRAMASGFAGLIHSGFILFTASTTGTWASVTPQIYIPVYILYGFLSGAFFSFVIRDGATGWTRKESVIRLSFVSGSLLIISTITVWIAYGMQFQAENAIPDLFAFLLLSVLFPLGILMTLRGTRLQETIRE
jgi:hypothetical protein